jgi:hypothetical protein
LCTTTGEMRAAWSVFGPDGRFDSLRWGSPPKIVPLLRQDAEAQLIPPTTAPGQAPAGTSDGRARGGDGRGARSGGAATTATGSGAPRDARAAAVARAAAP